MQKVEGSSPFIRSLLLTSTNRVDLYWLPLGAGGSFVRFNGRVFERIASALAGREPRDLYHSALIVHLDGVATTIEMTPAWAGNETERGVVAEGAVGLSVLGRLRLFRYEIRCWPSGKIPDIDEAVGSPVLVADDQATARRILALAPHVPTPVWGLDRQHLGEMWNSNSVISWLAQSAGCDAASIQPPDGGRAPGWRAGIVAARQAGQPVA